VYLERDLDEQERSRLETERERAYDGVAEAMNSPKFRRLLVDLVGWTAIGSWRESKEAAAPIGGFAVRRLDRLWRSIARAGRELAQMDESTRHGLRIQVKKMRYASEFLSGIFPHQRDVEKRFEAAVAELQESLGKLNDLATAQSLGTDLIKDDWLIGSYEERRHLSLAEKAYGDLRKAGPFWRPQKSAPRKTSSERMVCPWNKVEAGPNAGAGQ
jgi:CHAD domain-containing protein